MEVGCSVGCERFLGFWWGGFIYSLYGINFVEQLQSYRSYMKTFHYIISLPPLTISFQGKHTLLAMPSPYIIYLAQTILSWSFLIFGRLSLHTLGAGLWSTLHSIAHPGISLFSTLGRYPLRPLALLTLLHTEAI